MSTSSPEATPGHETHEEIKVRFLGSVAEGRSKPKIKVLPNGDKIWDLDSVKPMETKDGIERAGDDCLVNKMETHGYVALSDGMGGYKGGAKAAETIVKSVSHDAESIEWEKLDDDEAVKVLETIIRNANDSLAGEKLRELDEASRTGRAPEMTEQAGGTLVFVKIDKLGREHRITVGDSMYAEAHNGKVLDLDVEETVGATAGRVGNYNEDRASMLTNVIDGKGDTLSINEHNRGVRKLPPGRHRGFVASDGLERIYRKRGTDFKEHSADLSEPGNLQEVFILAMLNAPDGRLMRELMALEEATLGKKDDNLGCEFTFEISGVKTGDNVENGEVMPLRLNPDAARFLVDLGKHLENDPIQAALDVKKKLIALQEAARLPGGEQALEQLSTLFPAITALQENAEAFGIDSATVDPIKSLMDGMLIEHDEYFDRYLQAVKDGQPLKPSDVTDLVAKGHFLELDRLLALNAPGEDFEWPPELENLDETYSNLEDLLANPVMRALHAQSQEMALEEPTDVGLAGRLKAAVLGGVGNRLSQAQEFLGTRRGKVALVLGGAAVGAAVFVAHKYGLHIGGGGGQPHDTVQTTTHGPATGEHMPAHMPETLPQHGSEQYPNGLHVDHRQWFTGHNEFRTDVSVHGNKAVISIEGMHGNSYLGNEHFDPSKVQMHALVTDDHGQTFDIPIHHGRVEVDRHSDLGRMLSNHSYKKVEIAHLVHADGKVTAQMVSTDLGHNNGALPDHPTMGHQAHVSHTVAGAEHQPAVTTSEHTAAASATETPVAHGTNNVAEEIGIATTGAAVTAASVVAGRAGVNAINRRRAQAETQGESRQMIDESAARIANETADNMYVIEQSGATIGLPELQAMLTQSLESARPGGVKPPEMQGALQEALNKRGFMFAVEVSPSGAVTLLPLNSEVREPAKTPKQEVAARIAEYTNGKGFNFDGDHIELDIMIFMYGLRNSVGEATFQRYMSSIGVPDGALDISQTNGEVRLVLGNEQKVLDAMRHVWESQSVGE